MKNGMAMENLNGLAEKSTREHGKMVFRTEKGLSQRPMELSSREDGRMVLEWHRINLTNL